MALIILILLYTIMALYFIVNHFERCEVSSRAIVIGVWAVILVVILLGLSISNVVLDKTEKDKQHELYEKRDQLETLYLKDPTNSYTLNEIERHNDSVSWFIRAQDDNWIGVLVPNIYSEDMLIDTGVDE